MNIKYQLYSAALLVQKLLDRQSLDGNIAIGIVDVHLHRNVLLLYVMERCQFGRGVVVHRLLHQLLEPTFQLEDALLVVFQLILVVFVFSLEFLLQPLKLCL